MRVNLVYEGPSDLPFLECLVTHAGGKVQDRFNQKGAKNLNKKIGHYVHGAAKFFGLAVNQVRKAYNDEHPKRALLQAVREHGAEQMKRRLVRNDSKPGPEFVAVYREFAEKWDVRNAIANSDSLRRAHAALVRVRTLVAHS